jgi:hypothetical protein
MTRFDGIAFVRKHGVVLASAKGPVPNLADAVAGEKIRGSWWGHPRGAEIFDVLGAVADSPDVLCFKLVDRKVTFVHRRVWPALVRLAAELGRARLTAVKQEHTKSGAHKNVATPFPRWVPAETREAAVALSVEQARKLLGNWICGLFHSD